MAIEEMAHSDYASAYCCNVWCFWNIKTWVFILCNFSTNINL